MAKPKRERSSAEVAAAARRMVDALARRTLCGQPATDDVRRELEAAELGLYAPEEVVAAIRATGVSDVADMRGKALTVSVAGWGEPVRFIRFWKVR